MNANNTNHAIDTLIEKIIKTQNPTVVGLDPALDLVPDYLKQREFEKHGETLKGAAKAVYKFNKGLINALCNIVPAVKPQLAFYEALGVEGIKVFYKTVHYARERGMFVIADAKRGDIGSTAAAYADAFLGETKVGLSAYSAFPANMLTVNAYLGTDGVAPFVKACGDYGKGIFVLVKTSNPSSGELQDKLIDGVPVYELMGNMVTSWGAELIGNYGYSAVGAVVGATYPEQIAQLRAKFPQTFFLIPGYGAQGGTAADLAKAFDDKGRGGIVNSSRGIIAAYKKEGNEQDFAGAAYREAMRMKEDLLSVIGEIK
ncbi:MAG: orotidine-5'-phosphate decarboxylase [Oscillospiraceae bacterium]|nr:orotidine-5'-phosphate decarboxylase [Oscillospiraceae bacterium]